MQRGYTEAMRSWESRLAVPDFDFAPFAEAEARTVARGIIIRTYAELAGDPDRDRKLYELDRDISEDVPSPEPQTPLSYEFFVERLLADPDLLPDALFVAIDAATGTYAGLGQLWHSQGSDDLYNGLTGVRRAYRRRGIALALKLRGIAYAQAQGRPTIKTWNETNNRAMIAINEALGFVKQPAWIDFVKTLRDDDSAAVTSPAEGEG
jgi:RimJ/RimL family protein N-acetyltransferase